MNKMLEKLYKLERRIGLFHSCLDLDCGARVLYKIDNGNGGWGFVEIIIIIIIIERSHLYIKAQKNEEGETIIKNY